MHQPLAFKLELLIKERYKIMICREHKEFFNRLFTFFLQPLIKFRNIELKGSELFQYLYFVRNGVEARIESSIEEGDDITIVGKPGQGKSCLVHYMFIELEKKGTIFPIILDYRNIYPRSLDGILIKFVEQMRKYFTEIQISINTITEFTTIDNCQNHMIEINNHLDKIPLHSLTKRLVIFLDDLDYAEDIYIDILKTFFLPYATSDKSTLILSVRKPLLNSIRQDELLRHCYHIKPHEIKLPDGNLKLIIYNRLKSILSYESKSENFIDKFLNLFRKNTLDKVLYRYALKKGIEIDDKGNFDISELPFHDNFYAKLSNITYFNLREIEQLFPKLLLYELCIKEPSFNNDFYCAFIKNTYDDDVILIDLVSDKTLGPKRTHTGNSIYQNVLEYFYYWEIKSDILYKTMSTFGINKDLVDKAIASLIKKSFLIPDFDYKINSDFNVYERYKISSKGIVYVEKVLINQNYYEYKKIKKSNRSYYLEREKNINEGNA